MKNTCSKCLHFLEGKPEGVHQTNQDMERSGWCMANDIGANPGMLHCGGDDFVERTYSGPHSVDEISESCACGSDTCTCQVCGKRVCGTKAKWMEPVQGKTFNGNVCLSCLPPE